MEEVLKNMKIGVADYGMNMWYGGQYDYVDRVAELRKIGFDGIERIYAQTEAHALYTAANVRRLGGDFATCLAPTVELSMQWTAAFGKEYMWVNVNGKDAIIILPTIDLSSEQKNGFNYGTKINVTFGGNVVHMFSKATEKNLI